MKLSSVRWNSARMPTLESILTPFLSLTTHSTNCLVGNLINYLSENATYNSIGDKDDYKHKA
jgi:hypothetical protein